MISAQFLYYFILNVIFILCNKTKTGCWRSSCYEASWPILQIFTQIYSGYFTLVHSLSWSSKAKLNRKIYSSILSSTTFISHCKHSLNICFLHCIEMEGIQLDWERSFYPSLFPCPSSLSERIPYRLEEIQSYTQSVFIFKTTVKSSKAKICPT